MGHPKGTLEQRFWRHVQRVDDVDSCWPWTAATTRLGYGQISAPPGECVKTLSAHRVSWVLHFGPIPDDTDVLHSCDNPPCVRPNHLFLGTHIDNMEDRDRKGRQVPPRGSSSSLSKLTEADAISIRQWRLEGATIARIAKAYDVVDSTIYRICNGETWTHV